MSLVEYLYDTKPHKETCRQKIQNSKLLANFLH